MTSSEIQRHRQHQISFNASILETLSDWGGGGGRWVLAKLCFPLHMHHLRIHSLKLFIILCSQFSFNVTGKLFYKPIITNNNNNNNHAPQ